MPAKKSVTIAYWVTTAVIALEFLVGGAFSLSQAPEALAGTAHLGYPVYFGTLLGVWKVLGAAALLVPRFPRLKEWAYAGIFFDLTGAAVSHAASGDSAGNVIFPLVFAAIAAASWALRPESRRLRVVAEPVRAPALQHDALSAAAE